MTGLETDIQAPVIDLGSANVRAGFAGEDAPRTVFSDIVGTPKDARASRRVYVGDEARGMSSTLHIVHPVRNGSVTDQSGVEAVLRHALVDELRIEPSEQPVLVTEPVDGTQDHRERLARVLFDSFKVPALQVVDTSSLALCAAGRTTGVVVDVGWERSTAVVIVDGVLQPGTLATLAVGGRALTARMVDLLAEEGHTFASGSARELAEGVKERVCYVADDPRQEADRCTPRVAELPGRERIKVEQAQYLCPEALFDPSLAGIDTPGLAGVVSAAIDAAAPGLRSELYRGIVLVGGSTLLTSLPDRLVRELSGQGKEVRVVAPPERKYSTWIGGAVHASLASTQHQWTAKEQYDEKGPASLTSTSPHAPA
ncbi:rod shape-determining protein [Streptomyces chrestomyceticus]|uniref:rod shape-determining protein n=1 Tax=Streptomyces chrestomyceticus TaxID=68185 RepID=UPI0037B01A05